MRPKQRGAPQGLGWGWVNDERGLKEPVRVCTVRSRGAASRVGVSREGRRRWKAPGGVLEVCGGNVTGAALERNRPQPWGHDRIRCQSLPLACRHPRVGSAAMERRPPALSPGSDAEPGGENAG